MKAIKVIKPLEVEITEIERPMTCGHDEVIVRVTAGGICGSDIGIYKGTNSLATYPRIIGHEFGGYIEVVGNNVQDLQVGQQVAVDPVVSCGHCYACSIDRANVCSTLEVIGVHRDGGFRQYVAVPAKNIHLFHKPMDPGLVCMVEPFSIGMEVNERASISKSDKVLIMGSGPIGMCILQVAKSRGAQVIVSDIVESRLERAKDMGADEVVNSLKENLEARVKVFAGVDGIPVVVDTACQTFTFEQSVQLASPAGRIVVLGLVNKTSNICMADITKKELTILGSRLSNNQFDEVIEGFENGSLHPEKLRTDTFNYLDVKEALKRNIEHQNEVLKITLSFE
ncbi:MAG: zinc-binding alcohol dehydrogenase family protein [Peptostreptococcaceae bacterium]|nr:zinc-binding alcohol dehydrogenase family protein [Peptostreptococcaceae bacterium]